MTGPSMRKQYMGVKLITIAHRRSALQTFPPGNPHQTLENVTRCSEDRQPNSSFSSNQAAKTDKGTGATRLANDFHDLRGPGCITIGMMKRPTPPQRGGRPSITCL
jgi:hypothetical protein